MERRVYLKLVTGTDGKLTPKKGQFEKLAKYAAGSRLYGWGSINSQEKIRGRNVWYFSCSGHGGYVVIKTDGDGVIIPEGFGVTFEFDDMNYDDGRVAVQVYQFEEDCDWAILEYYNPFVFEWSYKVRKAEGSARTRGEMWESVLRTVAAWSPELIKDEDAEWAREYLTQQKNELTIKAVVAQAEGKKYFSYDEDIKETELKIKLIGVGKERAREMKSVKAMRAEAV